MQCPFAISSSSFPPPVAFQADLFYRFRCLYLILPKSRGFRRHLLVATRQTTIEKACDIDWARRTLKRHSGMSNVLDERTSFDSSETGGPRSRRNSDDRSSLDRWSQAYRSDEEPELDVGQAQIPYDDDEPQTYVIDTKEDMEKGLPPYGGCCGFSLQSLSVEETGTSSPETNFHEVEDPVYDDPNLDYGSQHINFGRPYRITYRAKFMYFKFRGRLSISRSSFCRR